MTNNIKCFFHGARWYEIVLCFSAIAAFSFGALAPAMFIYDIASDFFFPPGEKTALGGFTVYIDPQGKITRVPYYGRSDVIGSFDKSHFLLATGTNEYASLILSEAKNNDKPLKYGLSYKIIAKVDCESWQVRPIEKLAYHDYFCQGEPIKDYLPDKSLRWFTPTKESSWNDALIMSCYK